MQTIYLDISNKGVVPTIYAKQGEVGRKFTAVITDAGVPYVLDESDLLSAWYEGTSGIGNYTTVGGNSAFTVDGNKVAIELITQMLTNDGGGVLSVSINKTDGSEMATWNIPYLVEKKPGVDSQEAEAFYTAFSEIAGQVADSANRAEVAAENLENITPESIGSLPAIEDSTHPGCYYRMVDGVMEWLNPPMVIGVEYRTTESRNGNPVYTMLVDCGELASGGTFTFAEGVTTIRYAGFAGGVPLPFLAGGGFDDAWSLWMTVNGGTITIYGGSGYTSTITTAAQVWYTK